MLSKIASTIALGATLIATVSAHTNVDEWVVGGKTYKGYYQSGFGDPHNDSPAWWTSQGEGHDPVMGAQIRTPDIIAHFNGKSSPYSAPIKAGDSVTMTWFHEGWCEGGKSEKRGERGWDCSHHGFVDVYLARCHGDCAKVNKEELKFFKIFEEGLLGYPKGTRYAEGSPKEQTGKWGTDNIFYTADGTETSNNQLTVTIPKDIPSDGYVLRAMVMSIHNSNDEDQDGKTSPELSQYWPQAFNLKVTGGKDSAEVPTGTKGTDLYSLSDELIAWDLYQHEAGKIVPGAPGPAMYNASKKVRRAHPKDFLA
jgi:cellulase